MDNVIIIQDEFLEKLEFAGFTPEIMEVIVNSKDNNLAKRLLGFLKNELKINNFTSFVSSIKIQPLKRFNVGNFFRGYGNIFFNERFRCIVDQIEDLELSLEEEIELNKFLIIKDAFDSDIQSDFSKNPAIPILTFIPLLKFLIEVKFDQENEEEDFLDNSNIFLVDLSEIDPNMGIVAVNVGFNGNKCFINGFLVDDNEPWENDKYFFTGHSN